MRISSAWMVIAIGVLCVPARAETVRVTFGHADNIGREYAGSVSVVGGDIVDVEGWLLEPGETASEAGFRLRSPAPDPAAHRTSKPGARNATFFWAKDLSGKYQGYGVPRRIDFPVAEQDDFQTVRLTPDWGEDEQVIKLRFDPPQYAEWEIDSLRVIGPDGDPVQTYEFETDSEGWTASPHVTEFEARDGALVGISSGEHPTLQIIDTFPVTAETRVELRIRWTGLNEVPVNGPALHRGFLMRVAGDQWRAEVKTDRGDFAFSAADLNAAQPLERLDGAARVEIIPDAQRLGDDVSEDDYPGLAVTSDGTAWCAWVAHVADEGDRVMAASSTANGWSDPFTLTVCGDIHRARVAVDGDGRVWVVWSEQSSGRWNLRGRALDGSEWGEPQWLSRGRGPDIMHEATSGPDGSVWLTWQSGGGGNFDIYVRRLMGRRWGKTIRVTSHPASDWEPSIAVDSQGIAHIVWDSYRAGNYDVYHATCDGRAATEPEIIAGSPRFEAHATVACDGQDRVWIAWDEGDEGWGKDWGMTMEDPPGAPMHAWRKIGVAALTDEGLRHGEGLDSSTFTEHPLLSVDASGRVWMMYRTLVAKEEAAKPALVLVGAAWGVNAAMLGDDGWRTIKYFPHSEGRDDESIMAVAPGPEQMWFAWSTDQRPRGTSAYRNTDIYSGPLPLPNAASPWSEASGEALPVPTRAAQSRDPEAADGPLLLWGDLHRHTEISADGHKDGTLFEAYRYCIDAAEMDFLGVSDHNAGSGEYTWYRTQQSCDLFAVPGAFSPIYGYERSLPYPFGHRNVFQATRGVRVVPGFKDDSGKLAKSDTRQLYQAIRLDGSISIPHTTATDQGTDWADADPEVEPIMELFQGLRNESYEYLGAPGAIDPEGRPAKSWGFQRAGFAWEAWAKGIKIGVIGASDHISTHISYAGVYAKSRSRADILDAIRQRHTFAATDTIVLNLKATTTRARGKWMMGDEFKGKGAPELNVSIAGTDEIAQVDIIRDNGFVYNASPDGADADLEFTDLDAAPGEHCYYVRVIQDDGQKAWSSPVWITVEK